MTKSVLLASAVLLFGAISLPVLAADAAGSPPEPNPVVARVDGKEIHRSDVMREIQMLGPQAQQVPPQMLYPQILQRMIATEIVAEKGYSEGLQNDPEEKDKLKELEKQLVAETYVHRTVVPKITDAKIKERYDEMS